jgi:hypothetical protein
MKVDGCVPDGAKNLPAVIGRGRPKGVGSYYCEEVVEEIVDRMCHGETLASICRTDYEGHMRERGTFPSYPLIFQWANPDDDAHHPDFVTRFASARIINQYYLLDTTVDISRNTQVGLEETLDIHPKFGVTMKRTKKDMLGHRQFQVDTIHKYLSKINAPKWEARLQQPAPTDGDDTGAPDRLIIEGGLPDNEPPPPPATPDEDE